MNVHATHPKIYNKKKRNAPKLLLLLEISSETVCLLDKRTASQVSLMPMASVSRWVRFTTWQAWRATLKKMGPLHSWRNRIIPGKKKKKKHEETEAYIPYPCQTTRCG
jgi:hypothetical protein